MPEIEIHRPFYEPFIQRHFPGWAARRERARAEMTYRGAVSTRLSRTWGASTSYRGGRQADRTDVFSMRDRGRKVEHESPIGRNLLKTEVDNVVGSGFTLQLKTDSAEFNREGEERFAEWMEEADVRRMRGALELQREFYKSSRRDGDGGIILIGRGTDSMLQYIPGDLIATPYGRANGATIIDGVEVDAASRPIAFHVRDVNEFGKDDFTRIPARDFVFLTPADELEDLAIRSSTCYAQIFNYLDQLDEYVDAVVIAARMAAVFGLVLKEPHPGKTMSLLPTLTNSAGNQQMAITLENGMARIIGKDGDISQVVPQQPMNQTPDFIRAMLRLIGLPFDMPLELVAKDMSQVNFASARIGLLGYYRACRARQKVFAVRCLSRIFRWWIARAVNFDKFTTRAPERFWAHKFISEGWDYTDPVSEAQGDLLEMTMGTKSPQMVAAQRGRDFEEMQIEIKAANAMRQFQELSPLPLSTYTRDATKADSEEFKTN